MKNYLKTAIVLGLICAVSAVSLSFLNNVTAPKIEEYELSIATKALEEVACGCSFDQMINVEGNDFVNAYCILNKDNQNTGYILQLKGNGYGGPLVITASYDLDGAIMQVKLVSDSETPGVGKKAELDGYMDKFIGTGSSQAVPTSKDMLSEKDSQAVSGASITFGGISKALSEGSNFVKTLGGR